jgi:hypothetical protein
MERRLDHIPGEESFTPTDRLGLAYCRLNCWIWDEAVGEKPEGFDEMPVYISPFRKWLRRLIGRPAKTQFDYTNGHLLRIKHLIGEDNASGCWWRFVLQRDEAEWADWYYSERQNVRIERTREQIEEMQAAMATAYPRLYMVSCLRASSPTPVMQTDTVYCKHEITSGDSIPRREG